MASATNLNNNNNGASMNVPDDEEIFNVHSAPTPVAGSSVSGESRQPSLVFTPRSDMSRRSSFTYSTASEASFADENRIDGFIQPMTPVHGLPSCGIFPSWATPTNPISCNSFPTATFQQCFQSSFHGPAVIQPTSGGLGSIVECNMPNTSFSALDVDNKPGLRATLFPQMYSLDATHMVNSFNMSPMTTMPGATIEPPSAPQQAAQVIVPSKLDHENSYVSSPGSFDCDAQSISSPCSYMTDSTDLDLKPGSPYDTCSMSPSTPPSTPTPEISLRPRRRASPFKRSRRSSTRSTSTMSSCSTNLTSHTSSTNTSTSSTNQSCWAETHDPHTGWTWSFSGPRFRPEHDPTTGRVLPQPIPEEEADPNAPTSSKPNSCPDCKAKFARNEHLKRHQTSHSKFRPFFCPLRSCDRRISRSDNARDHIKTHLRPNTSGRRNELCSWSEMEGAIRERYAPEKVGKLVGDLGRWYVGEVLGKGSGAKEAATAAKASSK